jgi:hypothetical protein
MRGNVFLYVFIEFHRHPRQPAGSARSWVEFNLHVSNRIAKEADLQASFRKQVGIDLFPGCLLLLDVDHLAAGVEGTVHANFLAFELLYLGLVINIVRGAASGVLQNVFITGF